MRTCNRCRIEKPESEYYPRKDGRINRICKVCKSVAYKLYYDAHKIDAAAYRKARKTEEAARHKQYNKTHKPERAAYNKAYYEAHRAEKAAYDKQYRETHRAKIAAYREAHREELAEWSKQYLQTLSVHAVRRQNGIRRRAQEYEAFVEDVDDRYIFDRARGSCQSPECRWPGKKINWDLPYKNPKTGRRNLKSKSFDHLVPIFLGGKHERKNVQLMHLGCNLSKGTKSVGCQPRMFG